MAEHALHTAYDEHPVLARLAAGDEAALSELMKRYWQTIYLHCLSYLKKAEVAEEITQDIFIQVWKLREKTPELNSFQDWIFILTRNKTISELRKRKDHLPEDVIDSIATESPDPDAQLSYKELHQTLMQGMERLSPRRKEIFKLSRLQGKTHGEIAEELGISKYTVNEHILEALNFLRTYVRNHSDDAFLIAAILTMILYPELH